jgi:NAD(P)-dependent dehydrogenase (short-subunit alcohol dehydrogenase family)
MDWPAAEARPPFRGRTALVTGASRGIGRAVAQRLCAAGARVAMAARGEPELRAAAEAVGGHAVPADVADPASVDRLASRLGEMLDGEAPDILVNAAGAFRLAPIAEMDPADFEAQLAVNLRGTFLVIRAFLPAMLRRRSGHVLSIGSVAGRVAFPHNGGYAASKFGVRGLHSVLDAELRGTGVRATLVEPGATDTPLWDAIDSARHPGLPPREAMLSPDAVADAVLFALSRPPEVDVRTIFLERS